MNEPDETPLRPPDGEKEPEPTSEDAESGVGATPATGETAATEPAGADDATDEGLPEWEPLTPELVEDEAIRGDFMLRWAVILLALLMGWTVVQETAVLTHIRSGQVLAEQGYWPSGRDTLSSTAAASGVRWVQLSWLFDLVLAGVYGALGAPGLTLLKAATAAVVFWLLSRISLPDVPTWWGSVCAAVALVAVFPSLTATPAIVTLLGMTLLLWLLFRESQQADAGFAWPILVLMIVWNQLDDRAWIGMATLLAYAAGDWFDRHDPATDESPRRTGSLLPVAGTSLLALLLHPFLWESWLSPVRLYEWEYPARQAYAIPGEPGYFTNFPLWSEGFWRIGYFNGAALLLWIITLIVLIFNWRRVRTSHLAVFVTTSAIAMAGGSELAVASIVNAVLATLNAQQWYRASFRQTYSVEPGELMFSRGGRALTVIALLGLGFVTVFGRLTGADGRRIGTGFEAELTQMIDSYRDVLAEAFDDRPFTFRPFQGDVLNWVGAHPFVDSRLRLFAAGSPSIVDDHLEIRESLRLPADGDPEHRDVWQTAFDTYDINLALPRLSGRSPDYVTFRDLLRSPDWEMVGLSSATALFGRTDRPDVELKEYLASHAAANLVESQFRTRDKNIVVNAMRTIWPQPPSVYTEYFYQPSPVPSSALQLARHDLALSQSYADVDQIVASLYAALRNVHRGLAEAPNDRGAYLIAGQAYDMLWQFERGVMQSAGMNYTGTIRFIQSLTAFHNAIICDPSDATAHFQLFRIYAQQRRHDLALRHLKEYQRLTGRLTPLPPSNDDFAAEQQQMSEVLESLQSEVDEARTKAEEDLAAGMDPISLAQSLTESGHVLEAIAIIETDLTKLSGKPGASLLYARLLLEAGRTRDAYDQIESLRPIADQGQLPDWAYYASLSQLAAEDLRAALETLQQEHDGLSSSSAMLMLQQHPLLAGGPTDLSRPIDPLVPVVQQLQMTGVYFEQLLPRLEDNTFRRALICLELGMNSQAEELLEGLLERDPITSLRPLAEVYLSLLSAEPKIPPLPAAGVGAPVTADLFGEETGPDKTSEKPTADSDSPQPKDAPKAQAAPGDAESSTVPKTSDSAANSDNAAEPKPE